MTAAAYIRVSSRGQDHAMQRSAIERAAAARGDVVGKWFAEKRTATTNDRPELARLLADVRAGKVGRLYVFRLDRLTRTGIADTLALVKELRELGVEVVNLADGFSVPPPNATGSQVALGQLILAVLAWAAEMELHTRRERIAARRELADERGEAWGRPSRLDAATRVAIAERTRRGDTVRAIAAALKVPRSTVARVAAQVNAHDAAEGLPVARPGWRDHDRAGRGIRVSRNPPPPGDGSRGRKTGGEPPASR